MNDLLFAVPWWIPALLALIGIALLFNGNKTQAIKVRNAGATLVLLAIVWSLVSYFVDTDKEKVEKATRDLVQSAVDGAASGDWSKFKGMLAPNVTFWIGASDTAEGLQKVSTFASGGADLIKLKSARVSDLTTEQTGTYISAHCEIFTTQEFSPPMETSTWQFDWEKTADGWKVHQIRLLKIKDIPDEQLDSAVGRGARR